MSENEHKKGEEQDANGAQWTDQEWPPFKEAEETEDGVVKDGDYYRDHPDEIKDLASKLIELRGGEEGIQRGATWDAQQHAHVDVKGVPRDWAHLTAYMKENPDQIDHFVEEQQNLEYFSSHPEDMHKFVSELIRLRGGADSVSENAAWDNDQVTHVDDDGAPRDWAHLTKYLKDNPGELSRFVDEYMDLKEVEDAFDAAAAAGGGEEAPAVSEADTMAERLRNDPAELERICAETNGGEADPEEVQYYKDNPDKIPQLVEKYNKMKQKEAEAAAAEEPVEEPAAEETPAEESPAEEPAAEEPAAEETPAAEEAPVEEPAAEEASAEEDDAELAPAAEGGEAPVAEKEEPAAEAPAEEPAAEEAPETEDFSEYYPRLEGESEEMYQRRLEWARMVSEKSAQFPHRLPKNKHEEAETNEEWLKRVGLPTLHEYLTMGDDSGAAAAEGGGRTKWSTMSEEEKRALIRENKRNDYESTEDYAKRLGIKEIVDFDEAAAEGGEAEVSRETMMNALATEEAMKWLEDVMGLGSINELKNMSDEDLRKMYEKFNSRNKEAEDDKEKEVNREAMLNALGTEEAMKWLEDVMGLGSINELKNMSDEELRKLYEKFMGRNKEAEKDGEREKLLSQIGTEDVQKWIDENYGYTINELKNMSNEELQKLYDEYLKSKKKDLEPHEEEDPLVAARINREKDARAAAHDIAERMMSQKLVSKTGIRGLAQKIIMGGMFREGFIAHYEKQAYRMIEARQRGENVEGLTDNDWSTQSGLERFVRAYVEGYEDEMIHGKAGESMDVYKVEKDDDGNDVVKRFFTDENGQRKEEIVTSSPMRTAALELRDAISAYAQGGKREEFEAAIGAMRQELEGNGGNADDLMAENYMAVAEAARARFEHGKGIDDVMNGFSFINGEARSNVRTEAHRGAIDKITDRISRSVVGRVLPPEVVGTAASLAVKYGRSGVRNALIAGGTVVVGAAMAPAVVPVAIGMLTAGSFAALKERSRSAGDRATQARRLARGEGAGATSYDSDMEDTQYEQRSASKLTDVLNKALESGDSGAIKDALALVETATMMSDERGIDLIKYSSGDTDVIEQERIDMDVARAKAKAELRRQGVSESALSETIRDATEMFENDISAKDKAFRKLRRRRMAAQGVKSAITSGVMSVASQEVVSLFRPDQVGVLENLGVQVQQNNLNASNTLLAGALGFKGMEKIDALARTGAELTQQEIDQLRDQGYSVVPGQPKVIQSEKEVGMGEYMEANGDAKCTGYFGNGTRESDGNELHGYYKSKGDDMGPWTRITGRATGAMRVDAKDVNTDNFGFFVTIKGNQIYVPAVAGEKSGVFYPDYDKCDPWLAEVVKNRQFNRIQGGYMRGITEDGKIDFVSFWGYGGSGKVPETVTTTVTTEIPTYDVIGVASQEFDRAVEGFPTLAMTSRKNLTLGRLGREVPKPENIGGAPRTHMVTPTPEAEKPAAAGGAEALPPAPAPVVEAEEPAEEVPEPEPAPAPAPAAEAEKPAEKPKETEPETTEAEEENDDDDDDGDDDGERMTYDVPYTGPISAESESYQIYPSDEQIRESALAKGVNVTKGDIAKYIRPALFKWNTMDEKYRTNLLKGNVTSVTAHGLGASESHANEQVHDTLAYFGLLKPAMTYGWEYMMEKRDTEFDEAVEKAEAEDTKEDEAEALSDADAEEAIDAGEDAIA